MMKHIFTAFALFVTTLAATTNAFSGMMHTPFKTTTTSSTQLAAEQKDNGHEMSRSAFVASAMGAALLSTPVTAAFARGLEDANLEGTKSKENYRTCMSRCLYEAGKEGKSVGESTKACTKKCSTAKGQMTSFTPGE